MILHDSTSHIYERPRGFLVLEGVNGAGKSTVKRHIESFLVDLGQPFASTREPGGTRLGVELRKILLEHSADAPSLMTELLLFGADRAHHVASHIVPALETGHIVLSDRYYYSTEAFQGFGRGLDRAAVQAVNKLAVGDILPDLVLLLDVDAKTGLERSKRRNDDKDAFEQEEIAFHDRVRQGYLTIAAECAEPVLVIDASQPQSVVVETAMGAVKDWWDALEHAVRSMPG